MSVDFLTFWLGSSVDWKERLGYWSLKRGNPDSFHLTEQAYIYIHFLTFQPLGVLL